MVEAVGAPVRTAGLARIFRRRGIPRWWWSLSRADTAVWRVFRRRSLSQRRISRWLRIPRLRLPRGLRISRRLRLLRLRWISLVGRCLGICSILPGLLLWRLLRPLLSLPGISRALHRPVPTRRRLGSISGYAYGGYPVVTTVSVGSQRYVNDGVWHQFGR